MAKHKSGLTKSQRKAIQDGAQRIARKHGIDITNGKAVRLETIKKAAKRVQSRHKRRQ